MRQGKTRLVSPDNTRVVYVERVWERTTFEWTEPEFGAPNRRETLENFEAVEQLLALFRGGWRFED